MLMNVLQYRTALVTRNYPGVSNTLGETLDLKYSIVSFSMSSTHVV